MPSELVALIEGMALRPPPPRAAEVHRAVTAIAAEKGWPAPSYPVVRRIIAGLDRGLVTMAHHGPAACRDGSNWFSGGNRPTPTTCGRPITPNLT